MNELLILSYYWFRYRFLNVYNYFRCVEYSSSHDCSIMSITSTFLFCKEYNRYVFRDFMITRRFVLKFKSPLYEQLSFLHHINERWIHVILLYAFIYHIVYITSTSLASFIKESLVAIELFLCLEKMCAFICVLINILLKYRLICRACYKTHDFKPAQNNWHESISCDDHKKKH